MSTLQAQMKRLKTYRKKGFTQGVAVDTKDTSKRHDFTSYNSSTRQLHIGIKIPPSLEKSLKDRPLHDYLERRGMSQRTLVLEAKKSGIKEIFFWTAVSVVLEKSGSNIIAKKVIVEPVCIPTLLTCREADRILNDKTQSCNLNRTTLQHTRSTAKELHNGEVSMTNFENVTRTMMQVFSKVVAYASGIKVTGQYGQTPNFKKRDNLRPVLAKLDSLDTKKVPPLSEIFKRLREEQKTNSRIRAKNKIHLIQY